MRDAARQLPYTFQPLRLAHALLRFDLETHVRAGSEPLNRPTFRIPYRYRTRQEPPILPISPAQLDCVLPKLAGFDLLLVLGEYAVQQVGMMHFHPSPSGRFLFAHTGVFVPLPVVPG